MKRKKEMKRKEQSINMTKMMMRKMNMNLTRKMIMIIVYDNENDLERFKNY